MTHRHAPVLLVRATTIASLSRTSSIRRSPATGRPLSRGLAAVLVTLPAIAQVPHVERFDYPPGTQLNGQTGGTGWSTPWMTTVGSFTAEQLLGVSGVLSQSDTQHSLTTRALDTTGIPSVATGGVYGFDGTAMIVRFGMARPSLADPEVVQFGLFAPNGNGIALFSSPGQVGVFVGGTAIAPTLIPGTSISDAGLYTIRIDFEAGDDELRLYGPSTNPFTESPDLVVRTGIDFKFDRVGLSVQASDITNNSGYFGDITLRIAPPSCGGFVGCVGQPNSVSAGGGRLCAFGSIEVVDNDLVLFATDVPDGAGVFFHGPDELSPVAIGNGTMCIAAPHIRLGVALAVNGEAQFPLDTTAFSPGETRVFQFWHRDVPAGGAFFNFTESLVVEFQ